MRFSAALRGNGRRLSMIAAASVLALGLAACSSDDEEAAGTPFTQALNKDYTDLASQASSLPAEKSDEGFFSSLNPFSSSDTSSDLLSKAFTTKAELANGGTEPEAEAGVGPAQATFAREFGDYFTRTRMPPLRIADFNMSSVSQAS